MMKIIGCFFAVPWYVWLGIAAVLNALYFRYLNWQKNSNYDKVDIDLFSRNSWMMVLGAIIGVGIYGVVKHPSEWWEALLALLIAEVIAIILWNVISSRAVYYGINKMARFLKPLFILLAAVAAGMLDSMPMFAVLAALLTLAIWQQKDRG